MVMVNLKNMEIKELQEFIETLGEKKFRGKQIFSWIYKGVEGFDEMRNIPKGLIEKLSEVAYLGNLEKDTVQISRKDGTRKYLFQLDDGNCIESVFMKYKYGNTICVSSQAGCRMGCRFCASTLGGLKRNLEPGEILDQILSVERDTGEKINHIVVMGTGEPFDNYDNLAKFLRIVNDKDGLNIGMRNITVSTCGVVPGIEKFGDEFPQVNLAISLHGPDNEIRGSMMPINNRYKIEELLKTCREYLNKTNRRITFEYALVDGKNDREQDIKKLAKQLSGMLCHVNLIPLNKVRETGLEGTNRKRAEQVAKELEQLGIPATVRREMGADIDGACGQLRLSKK